LNEEVNTKVAFNPYDWYAIYARKRWAMGEIRDLIGEKTDQTFHLKHTLQEKLEMLTAVKTVLRRYLQPVTDKRRGIDLARFVGASAVMDWSRVFSPSQPAGSGTARLSRDLGPDAPESPSEARVSRACVQTHAKLLYYITYRFTVGGDRSPDSLVTEIAERIKSPFEQYVQPVAIVKKSQEQLYDERKAIWLNKLFEKRRLKRRLRVWTPTSRTLQLLEEEYHGDWIKFSSAMKERRLANLEYSRPNKTRRIFNQRLKDDAIARLVQECA
jgi:hypothetical protein